MQKNIQAKGKPPVQQEIKKTAGWKPYLALTIFAFILYSNTLNHFFALDDTVVLTHNTFTQQGIKGIPNIFKYDTFVGKFLLYAEKGKTVEQVQEEMKYVAGGRYRPLSLVTFALEVQFFGKKDSFPNNGSEFIGNAFVSHLNNILLYLFTTCLLYLILFRLFPQAPPSPPKGGDVGGSTINKNRTTLNIPPFGGAWGGLSFPFIATLLFLAHPIHTEVVANIKGRDEIMTLLGSLAALWFAIKYFDTNKIYNLLLSGLCLFLGLLSKENAITFVAIIPLTIYYFVDKKIGKILISSLPLIVALAVFLLIRASVLGVSANTSTAINELMNNPFLNATKNESLATTFYTLLIYVKLLFFPHPLTWDYYPYHIKIVNWANPVAILSLLFYLGISLYAIYGLLKKRDVVSYSIWFYLLPLTIVSNLFFSIGVFMGERFVFISSVGFCILVGWFIYEYLPRIKKSNYLTILVISIILCLFSTKTISRNNAWKDNLTLFETDIKVSKNSALGNYFVGYHLSRKAFCPSNKRETEEKDELCDEAAKYLKRAVELHPTFTDAIEQLGKLYFICYADVAKSLHYYARAIQSAPKKNDIYNSAVYVLNQIDILDENQISSTPHEILQACDELLEVKPYFGEVYYIKGFVYGKFLQNAELALIWFEKALSLDFPKTANFYANLGTCYGISDNYEKAVMYLLKAVELGIDNYIPYLNLGIMYQQLGDMDNSNLYTKKGYEMMK